MSIDWQAEDHLHTLTKCGICRDHARQIISMTDAQLTEAVTKFDPNKSAKLAALVAAAHAEIAYRKEQR